MLLRLLASVVILLPIYLMVLFVYPRPTAYWAALAALAAITAGVRLLGGRHAGTRLARRELGL